MSKSVFASMAAKRDKWFRQLLADPRLKKSANYWAWAVTLSLHMNWKQGLRSWMEHNTLAKEAGVSAKTSQRIAADLEEWGHLRVDRTKDGKGFKNLANNYYPVLLDDQLVETPECPYSPELVETPRCPFSSDTRVSLKLLKEEPIKERKKDSPPAAVAPVPDLEKGAIEKLISAMEASSVPITRMMASCAEELKYHTGFDLKAIEEMTRRVANGLTVNYGQQLLEPLLEAPGVKLKPPPPPPPPSPPKQYTDDEAFELIWAQHPRSVDEAKSERAFKGALTKTTASRIVEVFKIRQPEWRNTEHRYIQKLANWLKGENWDRPPRAGSLQRSAR